ncbi:MAG: hypothetical protein NT011_02965 [Kiritimatiellaeota bacterium]|nr:hypothetical protein [Kiritimatiellota bacterium]
MSTILFFDDWNLSSYANLVRKMGKPVWDREAVLEDETTEGTWNFPFVYFDHHHKKWKAVYGGVTGHNKYIDCSRYGGDVCYMKDAKLRTGPARGIYPALNQSLLYAESEDGRHWYKPKLNNGKKGLQPNEVLPVSKNGGPVFYDPHEPSGRKYKFVYSGEGSYLYLASSADCIHWEINKIGSTRQWDSPITAFYNANRQCYYIVTRALGPERKIYFYKTKDFREIEEPELVVHPDPEDPPLTEFYGMPVYAYENMYIGLLWRILPDPGEHGCVKTFGPVDCALAYSYDGRGFNRAYHSAFIPVNDRGEHGGGGVYTGAMCVAPDHTIRFYSGGSKAEHFQNQKLRDAGLILHTMRLDGFMYFETWSMTGILTTRCVRFTGNGLKLNVKAPYGAVRAQLADNFGKPYQGFSFKDCIPFTGDDLFHQPKWKNGKTPEILRAKRHVQIQVEITSGSLYAIRGDFELLRSRH